ncbi:MAG: FecR domain-containing protein, partial [Bacteroidota bacterium]
QTIFFMRDLLEDEFFIKLVNDPDEDTRHYWQRWLAIHPERKEDFEFAKQVASYIKYKKNKRLSDKDYDQIFLELRSFMKSEIEEGAFYTSPQRASIFSLLMKTAAVILFCLSLGLAFYFNAIENTEEKVFAKEELIEKYVPLGAKNTIKLTDGSIVKLNAGSQLKFPKQFADSIRIVEFNGEGFFNIARDEQRPFIIKTGNVSTEVLGTTFNIRYYENEADIEVALVSGNVVVNDSQGNQTMLKPTEMAVYSKETRALVKRNFDSKLITGWKDNILIFEKASLQQIKNKLEKWYGVNIRIALTKPMVGFYSGEFKDEPLDVVLEGIGYASKFNFEINGKTVTITN